MARFSSSSERAARLPRFSLPSGVAQIAVRLELISPRRAEPLPGQLWDISNSGGCVVLPGLRQIVVPAGSRLQLRDPMSHAVHWLEADLRWCSALSQSTFVGLRFTGGPAPSEIFLAAYMRTSWIDAVPCSRVQWP